MEDSTLLPYILEKLSRKAGLCDTVDNLCEEVEDHLEQKGNSQYENVRNSVEQALNVGENLGIVTLTNENVSVPFNFRASLITPKPTIKARSPTPVTKRSKKQYGARLDRVALEYMLPPSSQNRRKTRRSAPRMWTIGLTLTKFMFSNMQMYCAQTAIKVNAPSLALVARCGTRLLHHTATQNVVHVWH